MQPIMNWLKPVIVSLVFCGLAGLSNAAMDVVSFHYSRSVFAARGNDLYYNPQLSWKNKWKTDAKGEVIPGEERYPGSSTIFVKFTDFWHLAKAAMLFFFFLAIVTYRRTGATFGTYIADLVLCYLAYGAAFNLCFDFVLLA